MTKGNYIMHIFQSEIENKTKEELLNSAKSRRDLANSLRSNLAYADRGAYGQDMDRIRDYDQEAEYFEYLAKNMD